MENQKKNNKTYVLLVLGVLGAIVITLGITYAYWRLTKWQENENVVTTACLDVDIESQEDDINLPKAYPISDEDAESLVPFKFTVHNKCEDNASYQINLESMSKNGELEIPEDERLNPKYLKYKINEVRKDGKVGLLTGEKDNDTTKVVPTITDAYDAHILTTEYLKGGASKSYEFRLWMDSETTAEEIDSMNKTLVSKISVTATYYPSYIKESLRDTILGLDVQEEDSGATGLYEVDHTGANIEYTTEAEKIEELQKTEYRFAGKDPDNYIIFGETEPKDVYDIRECTSDYCLWISSQGYPTFDTSEECESFLYSYSMDGRDASCMLKAKAGDSIYWRVIGLVNTPEGQRVKIIRDSIGEYIWDISEKEVNDGDGVNEWSQADLMKLLNPNFDNNQGNVCDSYGINCQQKVVNNSLYWNGTSGNCYNHTNNNCEFTGIGMPEKLKEMIEEVTWNTGTNADEALKNNDDGYYYEIPTVKMYEYERSKNNGKQLCGIDGSPYCTDEETRTYTWRGKVGLMYPSDYGYATSGGDGYSRSQCLIRNLYNWSDENCDENDWLSEDFVGLTVTPASLIYSACSVFNVSFSGINYVGTRNFGEVRPSVYLKQNVMVVDGNGSKESPWILSIE